MNYCRKMLCISRYTDDTYAQHFGDERHKFYLEFRCNRPCIKDMTCCAKCAEKTSTVLQHSRKFDHGNVNEPIPDKSHIFGGNWYNQGVKKWGAPPSEIIEFALKYQKDARGDFVVEQEIKEDPPTTKKRTKPKVADKTDGEAKPVKRTKKPKIAPEQETEQTDKTIQEPKKKSGPKKKEESPYSAIINKPAPLVHKEVSLPTHLETDLEQIDTSDYEIEYVRLTPFEANGTTYFRDSKKNKLYKKIKEKGIGPYVGRWNPNTDSIITDIPDSDDEE